MSDRRLTPRKNLHAPETRRHVKRRALSLSLLLLVAAPFARAQNILGAATQALDALTPLQRQIERESARLSSPEQEERRDAVQRLGAMARPEASRAASVALGDASEVVRATAARAVLSLPPSEAAVRLLPLLRDRKEFVRREAAYALGLTRDRAATQALAEALARDKEAGVRGAAAVALGQIADPSAVATLSAALNRAGRSGLLARVTRSRSEENEFVRRAAAVALGQIGSRDGVPALVAALSNARAGDDVRREAARSLGMIGDPSAAPALRAVLDAGDPYLSRIAFEALNKLTAQGAAPSM